MKIFAPRNDWNSGSSAGGTWWNSAGAGPPNAAGVAVSERTAEAFAMVVICTRVISETMASLPCNMVEQVDYRTTKKATDHPLWKIVHDEPNPEQDIASWMDSESVFQMNWGNAYAEKQYDTLGNQVGLWIIHPSRIPTRNIIRNGTSAMEWEGVTIGQPGELIYFVNNDDGSKTPIPASDMFHVPGIMSDNGVTGNSIPRKGANAIGIAIATEQHAGALFKNGAVSNIALKSLKAIDADAAERLRQSWQHTFGGVGNHYKTLILDEMEPFPINMSPETTQLIEARRYSGEQITGLYRVPPHLAGDLSRATFSNIESQGLSFITYTMLPWIVRWEKAMQRQLLTLGEKKQYRFKFNVAGLLRGDQAARAAFYQTMFNLGAFSPNDILELEDRNPIEGGDQHFIQANNAFPLDKAAEMAQAQIDKAKAPPPAPVQPQQNQPIPPDEQTAKAKHLNEVRAAMADLIASVNTTNKVMASVPAQITGAVETLVQHECDALGVKMAQGFKATTSAVDSLAPRFESITMTIGTNTRSIQEFAINQDEASFRAMLASEKATDAAQRAITRGIQGEIEQLQRYEIRTAKDAMKRPKEFPAWRESFYQNLTTKLTAAINVFVPAAEELGFVIDADAIAGRYSTESIASLSPMDELPMSDFESGVEAAIEAWSERPKNVAEDLFRSKA